MTKLTKRTYYTLKNKHISNSKISNYLKCKKYFFDKHVIGTVKEKKISDALIIGSAVDLWITGSESQFRKKYYVVPRRDTQAKDYEFQLTETMNTQIEGMARAVKQTTAFKEIKGYNKQKILQVDMPIGLFDGICAIPDWYKITGNKCIIIDLKTCENAGQNKYYYKCLEYGYYRQMAMIEKILRILHPELEEFEYRHLVVEKDNYEIYNCYAYTLNPDIVKAEGLLIDGILADIKIKKAQDYRKQDADWENSIEI